MLDLIRSFGLLLTLAFTMFLIVLRFQAALFGVLAEIEALGLELLEVRRLPPR